MSKSEIEKKFSKHQVETAILVLKETAQVQNWVKGQAKFLGVDLDSKEGKKFFDETSEAAAKRILGMQ